MLQPQISGFVIDDEEAIADAIAAMLTANGYATTPFYSPAAAIDALSDTIPDFVITDFLMPEMDGLTLAGNIIQKNPKCRVIVLSGNLSAMEAHPDRHRFSVLRKPLRLSAILAAVQREMNFDADRELPEES